MSYLLEHPNPHAPRQSDGQYWGKPSRPAPVRLIVLHTSQSAFDVIGPDDGAENVAKYLARVSRPASYHDIGDSDSLVELLPDTHVAYGSRGKSSAGVYYNDEAIHVAFAGDAYKWGELDDAQVDARLRVLAARVSFLCEKHDVPIRRLLNPSDATRSGLCGHGDLDPERRSDPGDTFPWDRFLAMVAGGVTPPVKPEPKPEPELNWTEVLVETLPTLKKRTNLSVASDDDRRLQGLLAADGRLEVSQVNLDGTKFDGKFGPSTEAAVFAFQRAHGLTADGIVGKNTWTKLLGG